MNPFEKVSRFADADFHLPIRKTEDSAGYDFAVAEDIIIPSHLNQLANYTAPYNYTCTLAEMAAWTKKTGIKPTLVSTGVKCRMAANQYLEIMMRSSSPLKYWLIMANAPGIIDADYADNPDNEGEIFFQVINLSPFSIQLKRGDMIGQGIIKTYEKIEGDEVAGKRLGGFGSTDETSCS